jgi:anti-sigma factor RsiW
MTEHHPAGRELGSYLDGALSVRRAEAVGHHLAACRACSKELTALRGVKAALARHEPAEPDPGWLARVDEQVASGARPLSTSRIRVRRRLRLAAGGALFATGALGAAVWLAPPAPAPVSFQDEVRQHLVQMNNPLGDQTSYVVEARYP